MSVKNYTQLDYCFSGFTRLFWFYQADEAALFNPIDALRNNTKET